MSSEATSCRMTCSAYVMLYVPFMAESVVARPSVLPATRVSTLSKRSAMPVPCASRRSATSSSIWFERMVTLTMVNSPSSTTARTVTLPRNAILIKIPSFLLFPYNFCAGFCIVGICSRCSSTWMDRNPFFETNFVYVYFRKSEIQMFPETSCAFASTCRIFASARRFAAATACCVMPSAAAVSFCVRSPR